MSKRFRLIQTHVLSRHGDRTPGFNCLEPLQPDAAGEVATWWRELLQKSEMAAMRRAFPIKVEDIDESTEQVRPPRDKSMGVFGCLTNRGKRQMWALGRALRRDFEDGGLFEGVSPDRQFDLVEAYASNYSRTQLSAQAALAGIFGLQADGELDAKDERLRPPEEGSWFGVRPVKVADVDNDDHSIRRTGSGPNVSVVPIHVLPPSQEYINIFPFSKQLQQDMRAEMVRYKTNELGPEDMVRERRLAGVKERVVNAVPAYGYHLQPFSWSSSLDILACRRSRASASADGRRSRLLMGDVIDSVFVALDTDRNGVISMNELNEGMRDLACDWLSDADISNIYNAANPNRESDGITRKQFTHLLQSDAKELDCTDLETYDLVCEKMCSQFDLWYSKSHILNQVLGPMVRRIVDPMIHASNACDVGDGTSYPRLVLHSGHDISILPWLHLFDAWSSSSGWPEYSAALRIDLLRSVDVEGSFYVRVMYNQGFTDSTSSTYTPHFEPLCIDEEKTGVVSLERFRRFVSSKTSLV